MLKSHLALLSLHRRRRRRRSSNVRRLVRSDQEGFSLIEVVIAMGVFSVVAMFTAGSLAVGMKGTLLGKRREVATQEANRVIEVARSLSYNAIGLAQTDTTIASDPAIQSQGGVLSFQVDTAWEPILWATNPSGHPFNPHVLSLTRGSTQLTRYVYVSGVDSNADGILDTKRVTVRVLWSSAGTPGPANEVRAQTLVNESGLVPTGPSGGGDPPTCPAGGCTGLTPITSTSFALAGTLSVRTARGEPTGPVDAVLPTVPVTAALPTSTGDSRFRAVSSVNCSSKSAVLQGADNTYGGHTVTVTADDDARTATPSKPAAQSWPGSPPDPINGNDDVDRLVVEAVLASPVSCAATANDDDGALPADDGLPYEKGDLSSLGSLTMTEDLTGAGLPSNLLTAVGIQTLPAYQEIDHQLVSGKREVLAGATGAMGLVHVLKIPAVIPDGLVRVDGLSYGASVRAAAGTPSAGPTVAAPTINFRVYDAGNALPDGSVCQSHSGGYCVVSVNPAAGGFTGLSIDVENTVAVGLTNLSYETHVDVLPPAMSPPAGVVGANGERRWTAEYTPMSISSRLKVDLVVPDVLLTDTEVTLNLGTVKADACAGVTCL